MPPGILLLAKLVEARRLVGIDHPPGQHRALLHIQEQCSACCCVIRHRCVCVVALGRYQFRLKAGNRVMMRIGYLKNLTLFEIARGPCNQIYPRFRGCLLYTSDAADEV